MNEEFVLHAGRRFTETLLIVFVTVISVFTTVSLAFLANNRYCPYQSYLECEAAYDARCTENAGIRILDPEDEPTRSQLEHRKSWCKCKSCQRCQNASRQSMKQFLYLCSIGNLDNAAETNTLQTRLGRVVTDARNSLYEFFGWEIPKGLKPIPDSVGFLTQLYRWVDTKLTKLGL